MKRPLTPAEEKNLAIIGEFATDAAFLFLTPIGLRKGIMDAVLPVRTLLQAHGIHDYSRQGQGQEHKVVMQAAVLGDANIIPTCATLYRPVTKSGDPRIWFSRLGTHAAPNDVLAIFIHEGVLHVLNLSRSRLAAMREAGIDSETLQQVKMWTHGSIAISDELLGRLRHITASGPLRAVCKGDTAIGRTLEHALGVSINSSKSPDYRGIELKSSRERSVHTSRENRATLFAQVPDWLISRYKSSRALLDAFGYERDGVRKLYCTVAIGMPNSQGLQLQLLRDVGRLNELHIPSSPADVVAWRLEHLHQRLLEKHNETFWISAQTCKIGGQEHFVLKSIRHTRGPSPAQFDAILEDGHITVDHLIKRKNGRVSEKGPLFKIPKAKIPSLFLRESLVYSL